MIHDNAPAPRPRKMIDIQIGPPPTRSSLQAAQRASIQTTPEKLSELKPVKKRKARAEAGTLKLPVLSSLTAVEAYCHVPKSLLSELRKRNVTAFDSHGSGRVDVDALMRWIFSNLIWLFPDETKNGEVDLSKMTWKARNERASAIIREAAAAVAEGKAIDRNEVVAVTAKSMAALFNALDREITLSLPASLRGLSEQQIKDTLLTWLEKVKTDFRKDLSILKENVNEISEPKKET